MFPWEKIVVDKCWYSKAHVQKKKQQNIKLDLCEASVNLCILWKSPTFLSGDQQHTEC